MGATFGGIRQAGFVVRDIRKAMDHWLNVRGCGPFFFIDSMQVRDFTFKGKPSAPDLSIALVQDGPLQIELIQQNNDAPSSWRDFLLSGQEGLQHFAYWTTTFNEHLALAASRGIDVEMSGRSGRDGAANERLVYFRHDGPRGMMIELSEISGPKGALFQQIADAAETWDGTDPIRPMKGPSHDT